MAQKIATVSTGSAVAYAVALLMTPVLTRLYSPASFGILGLYASLLGVAAASPGLAFEQAIPVAEDDGTARSLLMVALCSVCATSLVALGLIALVAINPRLSHLLPTLRHLFPYIWILPLGILGQGTHQTLTMWAVRQRSYGLLARAKVTQGVGQVVIQTGLGFVFPNPWSLLVGDTAGRSFGSLSILSLGGVWNDVKSIPSRIRKHFETARSHRRFAMLGVSSGFINTLGLNAPMLVFAMFLNPWHIGLIAMADRMIAAPVALLGNSAMQVYIGEMSQVLRTNPGSFRSHYLRGLRRLNWVGFGLAVIVAGCAPLLAGRVLGESWAMVGIIMAARAPILWAQLVTLPVSRCLVLLDRQDIQLAWDIGRLLSVVGVIFVGGHLGWSLLRLVFVYTMVAVGCYATLLYLIYAASPKPEGGEVPR